MMRLGMLLVGLGVLGACESIQTAPKGSPRVEVQVVYEIRDAFYAPFVKGVDRAAVAKIFEESVQPFADVGLRFYAVPSHEYSEGQNLPDYIMTVRANECVPDRRVSKTEEKVKAEGDDKAEVKEGEKKPEPKTITHIKAKLYGVNCHVDVKLRKRRADAPALVVGATKGLGVASTASKDESAKFALNKKADEENDTALTGRMLGVALANAAKRAFMDLQKPVDREFEAIAKPASASAK